MNKKSIYYGILFSLIMSTLIFFMGYTYDRLENTPKELYQVYLDGKVVGVINNETELYDLIDKEQEALKTDYNVDKIYPPNNLEVSKIVTFKDETIPVKDLYEKIKDTEPFTVKGYEITINREEEGKENITIYVLNKDDFDTAVNSIIRMFVKEDTYQSYLDGTQDRDFEEGTILEKVSLGEKITIKEAYISTKERIYTTLDELSRYLLFGTDETRDTYTIKSGDTIKSVANANKLNVKEFLIVNPEIKSENTLLFAGQVVNIGIIKPVLTVITESTLIENQEIAYETQIKYDNNMAYGMTKVEQSGSKGLIKVTFRIETRNGQATSAVRINSEEIFPAVNEIIIKGGYNIVYVGDSTYWAWPTLPGYIITSYREWRNDLGYPEWHAGIDIAGTGWGSPVFSIQNGTVQAAGTGHKSMGNYVYVNHNNGYISVYMHLASVLVTKDQTVSKGDTIGTMGNTGLSTGTHLHLGVYYGGLKDGVNDIDPLTLYR